MKSRAIISATLAALLLLPSASAIVENPHSPQYQSSRTSKSSKSKDTEEVDDGLVSPNRWPTQVPAPKNTRLREITDRDDKKDGLVRYQTINFQFTSEVPLTDEAQESVGRLFETAYAAVVAMSRVLPIERATRKRPAKNKFRAGLYKDMSSYYAAGGPMGSAGVFKHSSRKTPAVKESDIVTDVVMVPFDHLGLKTDGSIGTTDIDSHTLVHEITHQFTCLNNLPVWANEGFSEYVGYIPYEDGVLDFDKSFEKIVENGKRRQGGKGKIEYPFSLEEFFLMSQDEMYEYMGNRIDTYYLSLMCVTYFVHMADEAGIRAFKSYLKDLLKGKKNVDKKILKKLYARKRTGDVVQADFIEAWAAQGVNVGFKDHEEEKKSSRRR